MPASRPSTLTSKAPCSHPFERRRVGRQHQLAVGRHRAHQVMELGLDGGQIGEDVGVIVFQVVQDGGARPVVHELRALVEKGRVVLVGLDHEGAGARRVARRHLQVGRDAADQEVGLALRALQDPGQHGAGSGLAVGAGHGQHVRAGQDVLAQPLRAGYIAGAAVQDGFHQRVAAADHVADHEQVGGQRQLVGAEAFDQLDALLGQLGAHRGVDAGVAAGDLVAGRARDQRQATHESAANTKNMQVHGVLLCGIVEAGAGRAGIPGARALL
ncbi:Uncharacterised protein [Bordetella pertussis]|nr:Uncharacterised protein [Bordetella pertussis]